MDSPGKVCCFEYRMEVFGTKSFGTTSWKCCFSGPLANGFQIAEDKETGEVKRVKPKAQTKIGGTP